MAFHFAHSVLSGVYFSLVRRELQVSANMQCIRCRGYTRVGSCERNLFRWKKNIKLSPMGKKWLRPSAEKIEYKKEYIKMKI